MATEKPPSIAIRVDGGTQIGSGHVVRCLTLAAEIVRNGGSVTFICRQLPGYLGEKIEREGHSVERLRMTAAGAAVDAGDPDWLQVPWLQDCEETSEVLQRLRVDWLVVDHYGIGADWERVQRRWVKRILVIDDLANRHHDCDILLDQNYFGSETQERYRGLVPEHCRLFLGPRYALLRHEYRDLQAALVPRVGVPRRVLVFFGGSDSTNETGKALRALAVPELAHLEVDVVLGSNHPAPLEVTELAARRPGTNLYRDLPTLANLMLRADLAIGAGGTTTYERLYMRLPSVVVTVAPNQERPISSLAKEGAVLWAGRAASISAAQLAAAILKALSMQTVLPRMVDGCGLARLCAAMFPPSPAGICLRRARLDDAGLLFELRNEATVREMSINGAPIAWDAHLRWYEAKLGNPSSAIFIGELNGLPIGQVRLDSMNGQALLSYSVDPIVRGLGFGSALVKEAVRLGGNLGPLGFRAQVKEANTASKAIFRRLGWREVVIGAEHVFINNDSRGLTTRGGQE